MAAVQELVHWLKSRRTRRKRKDKDQKTTIADDNSKESSPHTLNSREGMALPPTPLPGFMNWPDISRDCAQSPHNHYDEIPAYAIDTQLDILREARLRSEQLHKSRPQDCQSSTNIQSTQNIDDFWRNRTGNNGDRVPRRGTPWHQFRDGDISSPPPYRPRQGGDFDKVTVTEVKPETLRRPTQHPTQQSHQSWNSASNFSSQTHGIPSDRNVHPQAFVMGFRSQGHNFSSDMEKFDPVSDDSGVSSPSTSPSAMCQQRELARDMGQGRRAYAGTPHPSCLGNKPAATSTPTDQHYHGDSTDTYNEYDGSEPEYLFYLRKTEENLQKTRGVQNIARAKTSSPSDVTVSERGDSFDLTSVTDLSDISTFFSDEEVYELMRQSIKDQERRVNRTCSKSAPSERDPAPCCATGLNQARSVPPSTESAGTSQSAFRPYTCYTSHGGGVLSSSKEAFKVVPSEVKGSREMSLEERLSCRVTTGVPAALRNVSKSQMSHANRARPLSGVVTTATAQGPNTPKNNVLSDIMRMNYDRQILSVF